MHCFPNKSASNVHPVSQISVQAGGPSSCHDLSCIWTWWTNVCRIHIVTGGCFKYRLQCWNGTQLTRASEVHQMLSLLSWIWGAEPTLFCLCVHKASKYNCHRCDLLMTCLNRQKDIVSSTWAICLYQSETVSSCANQLLHNNDTTTKNPKTKQNKKNMTHN